MTQRRTDLIVVVIRVTVLIQEVFLNSFYVRTSVELALFFVLSPDFHELWLGHNDCLSSTEVVA